MTKSKDSINIPVAAGELRRLRKTKGLNQANLARKANINPSYVSQLELGWRSRVSPEVFRRLCGALALTETEQRQLSDQVDAA